MNLIIIFNYSEDAQNRDSFEVKNNRKKHIYMFVEKQQLQ